MVEMTIVVIWELLSTAAWLIRLSLNQTLLFRVLGRP